MDERDHGQKVDPAIFRLAGFKGRQLAGKYGFARHDDEDIQQELLLDYLQRSRSFDPRRCRRRTFARLTVNNRVATLIEARKAACRDYRACRTSVDQPGDQQESRHSRGLDPITSDTHRRSEEAKLNLRLDVERILIRLPAVLLKVCQLLMAGNTAADVAATAGISRATLYRRLQDIRVAFAEAGWGEMTATEIAQALPKCRKSGNEYVACCPSHKDTNPSLSIRDVAGKVLVKCHAGCSQEDVIAALKKLGLWEGRELEERRIVKTYDYVDVSGGLLYQTVRYDPKDFKQRRRDGFGGWTWRMEGVHRVLYNLPEVTRSSIIFVVEGEKDAETLRSYGFVATTNAGGAKAPWLPQFTESLRDKEVIVIPDADEPGWKKAGLVAEALIGVAASVAVLELPGEDIDGKKVKDITDWFSAGHSELELMALVEQNHVQG